MRIIRWKMDDKDRCETDSEDWQKPANKLKELRVIQEQWFSESAHWQEPFSSQWESVASTPKIKVTYNFTVAETEKTKRTNAWRCQT